MTSNDDNIVKGWTEELTAFPLNGKRLELLNIDHLLLRILLDYAYKEISRNPEQDESSEIGQLNKIIDNAKRHVIDGGRKLIYPPILMIMLGQIPCFNIDINAR